MAAIVDRRNHQYPANNSIAVKAPEQKGLVNREIVHEWILIILDTKTIVEITNYQYLTSNRVARKALEEQRLVS
jgi:hypothetical protein